MGHLIDGVWHSDAVIARTEQGHFRRPPSAFRSWVTTDGSPGASGLDGFAAEPGCYHLYVSLACPWAHRTLIMRALKGLQGLIGLSVTHWLMLEDGWTFAPGPGVVGDTVHGAKFLHALYQKADPGYTGRATVPILWDKKLRTIVNNESSEIIRMMNSSFSALGAATENYYPADLRKEIDAVNERVYHTVNNGVYRCGFASTQDAYEEAAHQLFDTLDWLEVRLATSRYLVGERLTEADVRLFTTLVRFDAVYHAHFKCSKRRLVDYPNLWAYTRELFQHPAIGPTVDFTHIRNHYFASMRQINPTGIVPLAYEPDFAAPHGRDRWRGDLPSR